MKIKKIQNAENIYFIGIKGAGMAPVAQILQFMGKKVSGSDTAEKFFTDEILRRNKIKFIEGFASCNIPKKVDLIIYSSAYNKKNNLEMAEALKRGVPTISQAEALAEIFNAKKGIAVCGSHGKTTTAALLAFVLKEVGMEPLAAVGSYAPQFKGSALAGRGKYMVIEADEYQNKLKYYQPHAVVLNNIDYDHPDYFKTAAAYKKVFADFIKRVPRNGFIVANADDKEVAKAVKGCRGKIFLYTADDISECRLRGNYQYFTLCRGNKSLGEFKIQLIGEHNVKNAVAVIAAAGQLGAPVEKIKKALAEFKGTARRMEKLGRHKGALFIDDYAHHPTEIKATLSAVRQKYPRQNIICVFMPHTYTRTKALFNNFVKSFNDADKVIILPIYGSAREKQGGVGSVKLMDAISCEGMPSLYIPSIKKCAAYLKKKIKRNDVVVLMGAGDAFRVWEEIKI